MISGKVFGKVSDYIGSSRHNTVTIPTQVQHCTPRASPPPLRPPEQDNPWFPPPGGFLQTSYTIYCTWSMDLDTDTVCKHFILYTVSWSMGICLTSSLTIRMIKSSVLKNCSILKNHFSAPNHRTDMKFFVYDPNTSKNKWKFFEVFSL